MLYTVLRDSDYNNVTRGQFAQLHTRQISYKWFFQSVCSEGPVTKNISRANSAEEDLIEAFRRWCTCKRKGTICFIDRCTEVVVVVVPLPRCTYLSVNSVKMIAPKWLSQSLAYSSVTVCTGVHIVGMCRYRVRPTQAVYSN